MRRQEKLGKSFMKAKQVRPAQKLLAVAVSGIAWSMGCAHAMQAQEGGVGNRSELLEPPVPGARQRPERGRSDA